MENLKLNELLRYAFPGVIAVLVLFATRPDALGLLSAYSKFTQAAILGGFILIVGSTIYSLHRALTYPLIYRFILIFFSLSRIYPFDRDLLVPFKPCKLELDLTFERWRREQNQTSFQGKMREWGSEVHFLYCTTWAILITLKLGHAISNRTNENAFQILTWLAILSLLGALVQDLRSMYIEKKIAEKEMER